MFVEVEPSITYFLSWAESGLADFAPNVSEMSRPFGGQSPKYTQLHQSYFFELALFLPKVGSLHTSAHIHMLRFTATRTACIARLSQASRTAVSRNFQTKSTLLDAQVFKMPAMSPTMEEGGIVGWKVKNGQEFAAGDVLLEVETDKATIDVEAQDDGIMWEILENDGASGLAVGKPIALLAEAGDDLSSLERPNLEAEAPAPKKEEPKKELKESKPESKPEPKAKAESKAEPETNKVNAPGKSGSGEVFSKANPDQKLTPAVELLLHTKGISAEEAYSKIQASGPKGRILKGDVLAYLGEIDKNAVERVATYIKNKEHLDLSQIKIAPPKEAEKPATAQKEAAPKPSNVLNIEFTSELGEGVSELKFQYAFEKALHSAIHQTYGMRFPEYANGPSPSSMDIDDVFDDLLVAPVTKKRFDVSGVKYKFIKLVSTSSGRLAAAPQDGFDDLLGIKTAPAPVSGEVEGPVSANVSFKVAYDEKLVDSKEFVEMFQESLLSQVPAKQLIITKL